MTLIVRGKVQTRESLARTTETKMVPVVSNVRAGTVKLTIVLLVAKRYN